MVSVDFYSGQPDGDTKQNLGLRRGLTKHKKKEKEKKQHLINYSQSRSKKMILEI